jgi:hypothetical protein
MRLSVVEDLRDICAVESLDESAFLGDVGDFLGDVIGGRMA